MPQVNLSALNGQELRQLLDSSRRRGDASLSYKILQEMAARREAPAERRPSGRRRPAEPRHIEVDLSDPLEADALEADDVPPMPNWRPPALKGQAAAGDRAYDEAELETEPMASTPPEDETPPAATARDERPLTLHDPDSEPFEDEPLHMNGVRPPFQPVELASTRSPKPRRFRLLAGLVMGVTLGLAIGWLGGWLARDGMAPAAPPAPAPIQTAALAPPAPPPPQPAAPLPADAGADTALGPGGAQASQDVAAAQPPQPPKPAPKSPEAPPSQAAAPVADGAALELPAPDAESPKTTPKPKKILPAATAAPAASPPAADGACAKAPTPADRAICGDPKLKRLQAELRQAYDEALAAHEDRALLREHQLAWRDARSAVVDPGRLARLYEERIRKLKAATAEALRAQQ